MDFWEEGKDHGRFHYSWFTHPYTLMFWSLPVQYLLYVMAVVAYEIGSDAGEWIRTIEPCCVCELSAEALPKGK